MMVTVLAARGLLGGRFRAVIGDAGRGGGLLVTPVLLPDRDAHDRFAAERIVAEYGKAGIDHEEQAEQHGQRLHRGKRQPEPTFPAHGFLSERGTQIVGRLSHEPFFRISAADDSTARRDGGPRPWGLFCRRIAGDGPPPTRQRSLDSIASSWAAIRFCKRSRSRMPNKKGDRKGRPFYGSRLFQPDQLAALLAGLSIAALSPLTGAGVVALDLMPWSRSSAIFSALSSLVSGGT
jgi:hypothetical protein